MSTQSVRNPWGNLFALIPGMLAAVWAYLAFEDWLYRGLDGSYYFLLARELGSTGKSLWGLDVDHLQGCSSLQFPVNFRLSLTFVLAKFMPFSQKADVYSASLAIIAIGSWVSTRLLAVSWLETAVFFILAFLALLPAPFGFYGLAGCAPVFPEVSILSCLCVVLMLGPKTESSPTATALVYLILIYLGITYPTYMVFLFPVLLLLAFSFLKRIRQTLRRRDQGQNRRENLRNLLVHLSLLPVLLLLGVWILGHLLNSAFNFFKEEMLESLSKEDVSFLFWAPRGDAAVALMILAWALSLKNILIENKGKKFQQRTSYFLFTFFGLQIAVLFCVLLGAKLPRGFALVYIEYLLYPLAFLVVVMEVKQNLSCLMLKTKNQLLVRNGALSAAVLAGMFLVYGFVHYLPNEKAALGPDYFDKPEINKIVKEIQSRDALTLDRRPFQGRTEAFLGIGYPRISGYDWAEFHAFQGLCLDVWKNDLRTTGLWAFGIPTLFQYSPLRDPFLHYLCRKLISGPADSSRKNVPIHTVPFSQALGLLGIRFIISDQPSGGSNLNSLKVLPFPQEAQGLKTTWWQKKQQNNPWKTIDKIYLYEISKINLGTQSPVLKQAKGPAAESVLEALYSAGFFEGNLPVAVHSEMDLGPMVPCDEAEVRYTPTGFWIRAKAVGPSCLLLPITFSHCLEFRSQSQALDKSKIRLIRANLAQTLIVFDREINGDLRYYSSPFYNPLAVWRDVLDGKRILGNTLHP